MELRNSEVLEQAPAIECFPQLTNPRKFIATKDSVELGDGLDKEIDAVDWWDRSFALGPDGDELADLGSEALRVVWQLSGGTVTMVLARAGRGRSRIRNGGTGGIPVEKTWCEEVQVQSATCPLSREHSLLDDTKNPSDISQKPRIQARTRSVGRRRQQWEADVPK